MVGSSSTRFDYRRTPSSRFTETTYPGGPSGETRPYDRPSRLFSVTLRRHRCLVTSFTSLLLLFLLLQFSTSIPLGGLRVPSLYQWPTKVSSTSWEGALEPASQSVVPTGTIYPPEPVDSTLSQSSQNENSTPSNVAVIFVLIMWSKSSAQEGALLIKSILMYNSKPSEFHIICDDDAEEFLRSRLNLVHRPRHDIFVKFYKPSWQSMLDRVEREGTIATDHSAGLPGLMKLFIHEIVHIEKGIFVDTDAFFIADPALLWDEFETLKPSTAVMLSFHPDQNSPEWNHASRICSCVMLLQLEKLRSQRLMDSSNYQADPSHHFPSPIGPEAFRAMYGQPNGDGHNRYNNVRLGDQGYWWAILNHRPDLFEPLSYDFEVTSCLLNTYNIGLGDDSIDASLELSRQNYLTGTPQEGIVVLPKLLHFNCLHGTDVYMDWEGWANPDDDLNQRWGAAMRYHNGYKWIWLNNGRASLRMETTGVRFTDEESSIASK